MNPLISTPGLDLDMNNSQAPLADAVDQTNP